jgi:hypothetical protein
MLQESKQVQDRWISAGPRTVNCDSNSAQYLEASRIEIPHSRRWIPLHGPTKETPPGGSERLYHYPSEHATRQDKVESGDREPAPEHRG